jgi:hypothetical protein
LDEAICNSTCNRQGQYDYHDPDECHAANKAREKDRQARRADRQQGLCRVITMNLRRAKDEESRTDDDRQNAEDNDLGKEKPVRVDERKQSEHKEATGRNTYDANEIRTVISQLAANKDQ